MIHESDSPDFPDRDKHRELYWLSKLMAKEVKIQLW